MAERGANRKRWPESEEEEEEEEEEEAPWAGE
jgi:hypothetical protein